MAEIKGFFDPVEGSPNYDSSEFAEVMNTISDGVAFNYLNELLVSAGSGLEVIVDSGCLWSKGRYYIQDEPADGAAPKAFDIDAATAGYLRIDRIVIEFDTDNATATAKVIKGAEVLANPIPPSLSNLPTNWQVSLAKANVSGGSLVSVESERVIGNGRTNPNVDELTVNELTTMNIILGSGGKIYIESLDMYIYLDNGKLMLKSDNDCDPVQLVGVIYGTTIPDGTYAAGTIGLEHE